VQTFIYALHFIACFVLIGVVLLQRGKGADLGASLGGGGANTIFGSRGAGNFLTKITTASAVIFMSTSLTLSYLGYQASDVRLFDGTEPFEIQTDGEPAAADDEGGLQEVVPEESGGLVEIPPTADAASAVEAPTDGEDQ
jgi:preprotein translocase subunit SecG